MGRAGAGNSGSPTAAALVLVMEPKPETPPTGPLLPVAAACAVATTDSVFSSMCGVLAADDVAESEALCVPLREPSLVPRVMCNGGTGATVLPPLLPCAADTAPAVDE
jgi:hypothetical protein